MADQHLPLPDSMLSEAESDSGQRAIEYSSRKEERAAVSVRKRLRDFLNGEESSSDEEHLGAKGSYQERESIRALRKKVRHLEAKMDALERRNDRLEELLVNRLSSQLSWQSQQQESAPRLNTAWARPAARNFCRVVGDAVIDPNGNTTPDFPEVDGQVEIGEGVRISGEDWRKLLRQDKDSLFCKRAVKLVWSASELKNRSVMGQPCRSHRVSHESRALSPVKLQAVANAYKVFVEKTPNGGPAKQRLKRMNHYICEMLNDVRRSK